MTSQYSGLLYSFTQSHLCLYRH